MNLLMIQAFIAADPQTLDPQTLYPRLVSADPDPKSVSRDSTCMYRIYNIGHFVIVQLSTFAVCLKLLSVDLVDV